MGDEAFHLIVTISDLLKRIDEGRKTVKETQNVNDDFLRTCANRENASKLFQELQLKMSSLGEPAKSQAKAEFDRQRSEFQKLSDESNDLWLQFNETIAFIDPFSKDVLLLFQKTAGNIDKISALASKEDAVLADAFPIGNILGGIIAAGHPWFHTALGRSGPSKPWPANFQAPFQIPDNWDYGHHNYLEVDPAHPVIDVPQDPPSQGTAKPGDGSSGWTEAWSAAFTSTRFR